MERARDLHRRLEGSADRLWVGAISHDEHHALNRGLWDEIAAAGSAVEEEVLRLLRTETLPPVGFTTAKGGAR
jgi:hypothetical protein